MPNVFFNRIEDETGGFWGYEFNKNADWTFFTLIEDKYADLDLSKPIYFTSSEFNLYEFESILRRKVDNELVEKPYIIFKDCRFRIQEPVSFNNFLIEFSNCQTLTSSFSFENCSNSSIRITNRTAFGVILLKESTDIDLHVQDVEFRELKLRNLTNINFNAEEVFQPKIKVENCGFRDFSIYNSKIQKLSFENSEVGYLTLSRVQGGDISLFSDHKSSIGKKKIFEYGRLNIQSCNFTNLSLNGTEKDILLKSLEINDTSNFTLASMEIDSLTLIGTGLSNILIFSSIIKNLRFLYFKIKENVDFNLGEYGDGELILDNAILKGVEANPSFLHNFKSLVFKDSSIVGFVAHSYKMVEQETIREMRGDYVSKIDFCREMNALMIEQNNKHYATIYRALELEFRAKVKDSSLSWFDKQVLNLNYWSNFHGTMPQKALCWILLLMAIQFGVINLDLSFQTNLPYEAGLDFLSQNYSYFIKPFTFLTEVEENYKPFHSENMKASFHPVTKGFDFLFKILFAYLLYQFIAAFRKFNK